MEKIRAHLFVSGFVQGVFFRATAQKKAQEFGLTGWARNLPLSDGRVEMVCEGEKEGVEKFIEWCREGPSSAKVGNVEVEYEGFMDEFDDFEVR